MSSAAIQDAPRAAAAGELAPRTSYPDALNPILVKELRSALRGRFFGILFPFTVLSAAVIAVILLIDRATWRTDTMGRDLFQAMYGCLLFAVTGLVPFSAFLSMGNEWDENTYDLLALSKLRPRQIVLGKLLSVGIEGLLYSSAFTPLLVFAFWDIKQFPFGGTALLITVGVALETRKQIDSQLMMRNYEGFLA